jgi:hypothetical protein
MNEALLLARKVIPKGLRIAGVTAFVLVSL